ncbi:hypothetical protein GCM10020258_60460 [Sphingomonas yabuuchiae]
MLSFDAQGIAPPGIVAAHDLGEERAPVLDGGEVTCPAQLECLIEPILKVTMTAFYGPILMGDPAIVAGGLHLVIGAQGGIAGPQIFLGILLQVGERRGEAIGAMLVRHAAKLPQRILKAAGQRREAFSSQHDLGMLPPGIDQREVIDQVRARIAGDGDLQIAGVKEIRHALSAWRMVLPEDDLTLWSILGLP